MFEIWDLFGIWYLEFVILKNPLTVTVFIYKTA